MSIRKIAIVGLGLMGGSLALACKKKYPKALRIGISRNRNALATARRNHWVHTATQNIQEGVADADLIIVCTPVDTFSQYLKTLDQHAKKGAWVTDVGSVKSNVASLIHKRWKKIHYVSAHPMVGSHERGAGAAQENLYDKGLTFLIRSGKAQRAAYFGVRRFWRNISKEVVETGVLEHDRIVSQISHFPHILAACLMLSVEPKNLKFGASGFKDMTRIAMGHPSIWLPIFDGNRKEIKRAAAIFCRQLSGFLRLNRNRQTKLLGKCLSRAVKSRTQI